jgi:hypothetical protein
VIKELHRRTNKWLKTLQHDLSKEQANAIIEEAKLRDDKNFLTNLEFIIKTHKNLFTKGEFNMSNEAVEIFRKYGLLDNLLKENSQKTLIEAKTNDLLLMLSTKFNAQPKTWRKKITKIQNPNKLDELIKFAITCSSVEELTATLG